MLLGYAVHIPTTSDFYLSKEKEMKEMNYFNHIKDFFDKEFLFRVFVNKVVFCKMWNNKCNNWNNLIDSNCIHILKG